MNNSQSTTSIDPVCGTKVNKASAIRAERDGATFYFCGDQCRKQFLSAPGGAQLHGKSKVAAG